MRPSLSAALSLSFLLFMSSLAPAQTGGSGAGRHRGPSSPPPVQSIAFGDYRLTLGLPKDEVLGELRKTHEVERFPLGPGEDVWWVSKSGEPHGGKVTFEGGVLVRVLKDWEVAEPGGGPPMTTMKIALEAMRQMIPEDLRNCEVSTGIPESVAITCGNMLVQLGISRSEGEPDRVWVYTVLGAGPTPSEKEAGKLAPMPSIPPDSPAPPRENRQPPPEKTPQE